LLTLKRSFGSDSSLKLAPGRLLGSRLVSLHSPRATSAPARPRIKSTVAPAGNVRAHTRHSTPAASGFDPGGAGRELWGSFGARRSKPLAAGRARARTRETGTRCLTRAPELGPVCPARICFSRSTLSTFHTFQSAAQRNQRYLVVVRTRAREEQGVVGKLGRAHASEHRKINR